MAKTTFELVRVGKEVTFNVLVNGDFQGWLLKQDSGVWAYVQGFDNWEPLPYYEDLEETMDAVDYFIRLENN